MLLDSRLKLSADQAVTASAISNVIDLQSDNALRDIASGGQLFAVITVKEAVTADGAATATFSLESDSTDNLATSATVHIATGAIGKAALILGKQIVLALPPGDYERYLGLRYTIGTGPLTAGKFDVHLTNDVQAWKAYAAR